MEIQRRRLRRWVARVRFSTLFTAASILSGCVSLIQTTAIPGATQVSPPDVPSAGWEALARGLERRIYLPRPNNPLVQLIALRIDPARFTFRVHYRPGQPLSLQRWQETLPSTVAFINANFFDPQNNALGLVVSDGVVYGQSFTDRGGTFGVANGEAWVRSNLLQPYNGEPLEQAAQAFPMLLVDGTASYTNSRDVDVSRRTVVAQDSSGRIIFLVTALAGLSLPELSAYLPTTDLNLVYALNLDGGGSTMLYVGAGPSPQLVHSFDAVPAVIAVYPRATP